MTDSIENAETGAKPTAGATLSAIVLLLLAVLALDPLKLAQASSAEKLTLLFLAICAAIVAYSPWRRRFENAEAATFVFAAAWFIIYALARRAGPDEGWSVSLANEPDISFKISYAARFAVAGAVTAAALNRTVLSVFTRASLVAMLISAVLLLGNYVYLSQFFPVGEMEILNPVPVTQALMQLVEYGAVAVLCGIAAANSTVRRVLLKILPALLLVLWARHQFGPVPVEEEDE